MTTAPTAPPQTPPTTARHYARLVADIGGTWARFGLIEEAGDTDPKQIVVVRCEDHVNVAHAAAAYLRSQNAHVDAATLAVACPVVADEITLTNSAWRFSRRQLQEDLELGQLHVVNDFAALAQAIPLIAPDQLRTLSIGQPPAGRAPILVIGPGTGLGVSALLPNGSGWQAIEGEGGHRDLAATTSQEWQLLGHLRQEFGHVSAERVLSGSGLVNLYQAFRAIDGLAPLPDLGASSVVERAVEGEPTALQTTRTFSRLLGRIVGDATLIFGAVGGVYLGGGVLPRMAATFDVDIFLESLFDKGRFEGYLKAIPVHLILDPVAALRGAAQWSTLRPRT